MKLDKITWRLLWLLWTWLFALVCYLHATVRGAEFKASESRTINASVADLSDRAMEISNRPIYKLVRNSSPAGGDDWAEFHCTLKPTHPAMQSGEHVIRIDRIDDQRSKVTLTTRAEINVRRKRAIRRAWSIFRDRAGKAWQVQWEALR